MEKTLVQLPLFQEDSLANPSPLREREREQTMIATSGMRCYELFRVVNPPGLLAKMLKGLLTSKTAWYSDRCKMIWKERASKSNVLLFQLVASVRGINETESGLLDAMYPTPRALEIDEKIETWRARMKKIVQKGGKLPSVNLSMTVKMYPTPTAGNCMDVFQPPEYVEQNTTGWTVTRKGTGTKFGAKLNDVVHKMTPQPGGRLNPNFVEFLMGYPMNYTQIEPTESKHSETQSCHKSQNKSSGVS